MPKQVVPERGEAPILALAIVPLLPSPHNYAKARSFAPVWQLVAIIGHKNFIFDRLEVGQTCFAPSVVITLQFPVLTGTALC